MTVIGDSDIFNDDEHCCVCKRSEPKDSNNSIAMILPLPNVPNVTIVLNGHISYSALIKGGITPEEDHEDLTTSWKIEGRSENVVKIKPFQVYKIILRPYHVLTTFAPRPCQFLATSIRFPMSSYHALTTLTPFIVRSYYVLNTTKQTTLRAYHAFSTF